MGDSLREKIYGMRDWLIEIRRTIHMHPELGFEEVETARLVSEWLDKFGLEVTRGMAKTGVVGLLRGNSRGRRSPSGQIWMPFPWTNRIAFLMLQE